SKGGGDFGQVRRAVLALRSTPGTSETARQATARTPPTSGYRPLADVPQHVDGSTRALQPPRRHPRRSSRRRRIRLACAVTPAGTHVLRWIAVASATAVHTRRRPPPHAHPG